MLAFNTVFTSDYSSVWTFRVRDLYMDDDTEETQQTEQKADNLCCSAAQKCVWSRQG